MQWLRHEVTKSETDGNHEVSDTTSEETRRMLGNYTIPSFVFRNEQT